MVECRTPHLDEFARHADIEGAIHKMCLAADEQTQQVGLLLRAVNDLHERRADDSLCDSCAQVWPCATHERLTSIARLGGF